MPSIHMAAARALVTPKPGLKPGQKIKFERDDTPADAERVLGINVTPDRRKRPGPTPKDAPIEARSWRKRVRDVREQISLVALPVSTGEISTAPSMPTPKDATLSDAEMAQVVEWTVKRYGPILDIEQASEVSKLAKQTIRQRVSEGRYADSVIRGRPLRFWTHRFLKAVMEVTES